MAKARRPPALRHGLTSRAVREEWSDDVLRLAEAILGASPLEPQLLEAARAEAEAILYLRRVQHCRLLVLEEETLRRCTPTGDERALALELSRVVKGAPIQECRDLREELRAAHYREWAVDIDTAAMFILGDELGARARELRRLGEYERRAHSAHRKALRRLDYERVEAERRLVTARAANSAASNTA